MNSKIEWHTAGQGFDLVLIHGWGMNGAVWQDVIPMLAQHYRVHWFDLPGYGENVEQIALSLEDIVEQVLAQAPLQATWLGWSLGGLIASKAALVAPERISKLITVASSPCFMARDDWYGIQPQILINFQNQLMRDFSLTVDRFLTLQALGSSTAKQDICSLKQAVLSRQQPQYSTLAFGLDLLMNVDLREEMGNLSQPWLVLYGRLDALVPIKLAPELARLYPHSQSHIFINASHAPFISAPDEFVTTIIDFINE